MTKICGCGSCHDAAERAAQLVSKAIDDDECAIFVYAICCAMMAIGRTIEYSTLQSVADEGGIEGLTGLLGVHIRARNTEQAIDKLISEGSYIDVINAALTRYHDRQEQLKNVTKDT